MTYDIFPGQSKIRAASLPPPCFGIEFVAVFFEHFNNDTNNLHVKNCHFRRELN